MPGEAVSVNASPAAPTAWRVQTIDWHKRGPEKSVSEVATEMEELETKAHNMMNNDARRWNFPPGPPPGNDKVKFKKWLDDATAQGWECDTSWNDSLAYRPDDKKLRLMYDSYHGAKVIQRKLAVFLFSISPLCTFMELVQALFQVDRDRPNPEPLLSSWLRIRSQPILGPFDNEPIDQCGKAGSDIRKKMTIVIRRPLISVTGTGPVSLFVLHMQSAFEEHPELKMCVYNRHSHPDGPAIIRKTMKTETNNLRMITLDYSTVGRFNVINREASTKRRSTLQHANAGTKKAKSS